MSFDIYGNPLARGHCEVHPHVHEEYPCSVCISEKQSHYQQQNYQCSGGCESEHYLGQAQEHIEHLKREIELLRQDAERYRCLRDPCSGVEHAIFYSRGDYGRGLMSENMLDDAVDSVMQKKKEAAK
ncbi:MAG: hypothetical protein WC997_02240 [Porticoccaceae bacterium]